MNVEQIPGQAWENPATMSTSYGFCEKEETGDSYRPDMPMVLTSTTAYDKGDIKDITLLGSRQKIAWHASEKGIVIDGPEELQGEHVWTFRIEK